MLTLMLLADASGAIGCLVAVITSLRHWHIAYAATLPR